MEPIDKFQFVELVMNSYCANITKLICQTETPACVQAGVLAIWRKFSQVGGWGE